MKSRFRALLPIFLLLGGVLFWLAAESQEAALGNLREAGTRLLLIREAHPIFLGTAYFLVYSLSTALSFPWAAFLTVLGGAVFGFWPGIALVSLASTLGATGAFWLSRTLLRERVQARFGDRLRAVNEGFEKDGAYYLFTIRLIPAIPFFLVNVLMALTPIRPLAYTGVTLVGTLPVIAVYVNAGTRLAELGSTGEILSAGLVVSLALIGALPLLSRWAIRRTGLAGAKRGLDRAARR